MSIAKALKHLQTETKDAEVGDSTL